MLSALSSRFIMVCTYSAEHARHCPIIKGMTRFDYWARHLRRESLRPETMISISTRQTSECGRWIISSFQYSICTINSGARPKIDNFCRLSQSSDDDYHCVSCRARRSHKRDFYNTELAYPHLLFSTLITCFTFLEFQQMRPIIYGGRKLITDSSTVYIGMTPF